MAGKARIGSFSQITSVYGGFINVLKPVDNRVTLTSVEQTANQLTAAQQALFDQLKAAQQGR